MSQSVGITTRPDSEDLAFSDIFAMLLRHRGVLLTTVALCFAVGILLSLAPRKYAADSMLRVQPGVSSQYRTSQAITSSPDVADQLSPYVDILQSRTLYLHVARDLDLANNPEFMGSKPLSHQSLEDPAVREKTIRAMRDRIAVTHKPKDEIIRVSCSTLSPALSARVVNTLINDYVEYLVQARYGASKRSSGWLIHQLDDLKQQVERDQTDLTQLQSKLGVVGLNETGNDYLFAQSLNSLTKAASDATIDRIVAEAKYRFLQESDPGLIEGEVNLLGGSNTAQGSLLQNLRNALATQSSNYARLLAQFGPNYPAVRQQKAQLDETTRQVKAEQGRILNQARLSYSAATSNEKMTERALSGKRGEAFSLQSDMVKYAILQHDYQAHRTLYETLISRLQEAGITAGLEGGEVDIVDLADVPTLPAPPGRLTYLLGSLATGFVLGCLLALLAEAISTSVITADQARRASSVPPLAILPHFTGGGGLDLAEDSPYLEAVESLRTSLLSTGPSLAPKVLLFTSAVSGEGKSTIAVHLAAVLAQHRARVLLVDCDLRHDTLGSRLGLSSSLGLGTVLRREARFETAVQSISAIPGLDVLPSGPLGPTRATILLGSAEMQGFLDLARERYDFVVLNGPPTLGLSDVLNVGRFADAVLLVIRSRVATRARIKQAEQRVQTAQLPLLGYVLNGVRPEFREYGYKGYGNSYAADAKGAA